MVERVRIAMTAITAITARIMQTSQMVNQKSPKNIAAKTMPKDEWGQIPKLSRMPNTSKTSTESNTGNTEDRPTKKKKKKA